MVPLRTVDNSVIEALLEADNPLTPLFHIDPESATEIFLALLIREPLPKEQPDWLSYDSLHDFVHLNEVRDWSPAMYFRGPFMAWLQSNPPKAVDAIIRLVDFATVRWMEAQELAP